VVNIKNVACSIYLNKWILIENSLLWKGGWDMQSNQTDRRMKKIEMMISAFNKLQKLPKTLIKYGIYIFTGIFVTGMILVILNNTVLQFDPYLDMVSKEIVKISFIIAAEAVIGGLIMDYVFRK
jgi:hypothetical protein